MKKILLLVATYMALSLNSFAQNNVQLNVHHFLANDNFAFSQGAKNNIDHDFNVTRLQYYISKISLIHDGGTETAIPDLHILVDASQATNADLGDLDVTNVEQIKFHIGVDPVVNHNDPALLPAGHPLAPMFPSMHWGWAPGYRFVAIEGKGGANFSNLYQLHGLGDDNYFQTAIEVNDEAVDGVVTIDVSADYTRVLENISVNNGLIVHGDYDEARQALENFRDYVFSASPLGVATVDYSEVSDFEVYPNPTANGLATIQLDATQNLVYDVLISDVAGKRIQTINQVASNSAVAVNMPDAGLYFVSLIKEGQAVITKKLMVK